MKNKIIGIYSIRNKKDKKIYIGYSKDIERRWRNHKRQLDKGIHINSYLQNSWNKNGEDNFIFEMIEECKEEELIEKEKYWINKLKSRSHESGYNLNSGGRGNLGMIVSDELRKKFSEMSSGNKNPMFGKHHSIETKNIFKEQRTGNKNGVGNKNNSGLVKKYKNATSKYYGVFLNIYKYNGKETIKWKSRFSLNAIEIKLGTFDDEIDAAKAWDKKSWEIHNDLSKLNFPNDYKNKKKI